MSTGFSDCLVLKIQEVCSHLNEVDVELFVLYDQEKNYFVIRGRRKESSSFEFTPFSFACDFASDVYDFINTIIYKKNILNVTLYNYTDLPKTSDDITFESLESDEDIKNEIVGYDDAGKNKQWFLRMIRSLRNVYNH